MASIELQGFKVSRAALGVHHGALEERLLVPGFRLGGELWLLVVTCLRSGDLQYEVIPRAVGCLHGEK